MTWTMWPRQSARRGGQLCAGQEATLQWHVMQSCCGRDTYSCTPSIFSAAVVCTYLHVLPTKSLLSTCADGFQQQCTRCVCNSVWSSVDELLVTKCDEAGWACPTNVPGAGVYHTLCSLLSPPAEIGRKVCSKLQILLAHCVFATHMQHDVAPRQACCMKPDVVLFGDLKGYLSKERFSTAFFRAVHMERPRSRHTDPTMSF
mmetsp:Transcript_395/g.1346  ORF Transcript_395/g.1346 Transcript_395/m.1346 type:complete len:202 (-) Transcript_395:1644-2249(-)